MTKKHLLLIIMGLLYVGPNMVYAEFSNDCKVIQNGVNKAMETFKNDVKSQWSPLLDEKTIGQATQNLSNRCNNVIGGAESKYIFDHLIDLSFRKLDAYADPTLRYNLDADIKGKEWQKLVTTFVDPSSNTKPEQVIEAFNTYRPSTEIIGTSYVPSNTCNIANTEKLSLRGRYKAACIIAKCLSEKKVLVSQNNTDQTSAVLLQSRSDICDSLSTKRYEAELSYARQIVARVGVRSINNLVEQYTKNYFVGNRRQNLYEQFTTFNQNLSFVNRKIQEGTPVCSAK